MAMELAGLIKKVEHKDIRLLAGAKGVHALVSWVHMVENIEATRFLEGGELAIVTGIGLSDKEERLNYLVNLHKSGAAGLIVNTGPFIEEVSQETIEYCNENDFPLYEVPWRIHLAEIIRLMTSALTKEEQRQYETEAAFKNAINFPKQEELFKVSLSRRGFDVEWPYSAAVIRLASTKDNIRDRIDEITIILERSLRRKYDRISVFTNNLDIVIVAANMDAIKHREMISMAKEECRVHLSPKESISMGVGRMTKSIRCLYKSYNQAKAIQKLNESGKIENEKIFYGDLGFYRLLLGYEDMEAVREYYNCTLGPLEEYDKTNDTDFCQALKCYLEHNGSVKETADELFVHRNTINYKLNRIEEILDVDLSALNNRLELLIAFTIKNILI